VLAALISIDIDAVVEAGAGDAPFIGTRPGRAYLTAVRDALIASVHTHAAEAAVNYETHGPPAGYEGAAPAP